MADIAPLSEQSEVDQLDLLLGKTTGLLEADDRISRCVARFLKKAWRSRKCLSVILVVSSPSRMEVDVLCCATKGRCSYL